MSTQIPESHRYLIEGAYNAVLTTVLPNGYPHSTLVWCNVEGSNILVNTMEKFQKHKNMRKNPNVNLVIFDAINSTTCIEVRGLVVELTKFKAMEHLDELSQLYTGKQAYFGEVVPEEYQTDEIPIKCVIEPHTIMLDRGL